MRNARRVAAATLAAALVLFALVAAAGATTLDMNESRFRATWREWSFTALEFTVSCAMTLEGSFASQTFAKTAGATIARVTSASLGACSGGEARVLTETLPWSLRYGSFAGTLPNITSVATNLVGGAFSIHPTGTETCLGRTEERSPIGLTFEREAASAISGARLNEALSIPLTGGALCGFVTGRVRGRGTVTQGGTTRALKLYLESPPSTALVDAGTRGTISNLTMTEPVAAGTKTIGNSDPTEDVTAIVVSKEGREPGQFNLLAGNGEDCSRANLTLMSGLGNSCTVRITYAGTPAQRPAEMIIRIQYRLGNNVMPSIQRFNVIAN